MLNLTPMKESPKALAELGNVLVRKDKFGELLMYCSSLETGKLEPIIRTYYVREQARFKEAIANRHSPSTRLIICLEQRQPIATNATDVQ